MHINAGSMYSVVTMDEYTREYIGSSSWLFSFPKWNAVSSLVVGLVNDCEHGQGQ